jgi:hypothetical protein
MSDEGGVMPSDVMQKPYLFAELALALRDIGGM